MLLTQMDKQQQYKLKVQLMMLNLDLQPLENTMFKMMEL